MFPPQVDKSKSQEKFSKEDDFLDEADIEEKFKNKPDQLARVMAQKPSFVCPITGAELRTVPTYRKLHADGA